MRHTQRLGMTSIVGFLMVLAVVSGLRAYAGVVVGTSSSRSRSRAHSSTARAVVINEVAWMGTQASWADEWIELYNCSGEAVDLAGWSITAADGAPDIQLSGIISSHSYFLLERTDDTSVSSIPADQIYIGALENSPDGDTLALYDGQGAAVDTANLGGGAWPAGDNTAKRTMERIDPTAPDEASNWCTNDGVTRNGLDADNGPINGTPKARNACYQPPPVPAANLSITKHGPSSVGVNDPITYRITLSNTGTVTAFHSLLTDTLPPSVTSPTQTSPFTFSAHSRDLVWDVGDVPPGATFCITVVGRVSATVAQPATLANVVTASTTASETMTSDNSACCTTTVSAAQVVFLPQAARNYVPPPYGVIIEGLLYDGLQISDQDEAVLLFNGGYQSVNLQGWQLCKLGTLDWTCADLPALEIGPRERLWLGRSMIPFARSFGFELAERQVLASWPPLSNTGDEVALRDNDSTIRDVVVFKGGFTEVDGWEGLAVQPYRGASFREEGQILYRRPDEETGWPAEDTDTAIDWAQGSEAPANTPRVRYPGWDLERFYHPAVATSGTVTAGVAPDNAYQLVVDTIHSARESIQIEAYTLEHCGLVAALVARAQQGVTVTVLLEGGPVGGVENQELWACQQLHATGHGTCYFMVQADAHHIYPRYRFVHTKVVIIDGRRLLLGSQNLVHTSLPGDDKSNGTGGSRGVVLVTDAPQVVARAIEIFEADCDPDTHIDVDMWGPENKLDYGLPPAGFTPDCGGDWVTYTVQFPNWITATGTEFELVTAPENALRRSDALLGLVGRAGPGDDVSVEQLYEHMMWGDDAAGSLNARLQAYIDAARRGARVRILLNGGSFELDEISLIANIEAAAYVNEIAQLEGLNLSAHLGDPTQYGIHNKMVLVDLGTEGKIIHVGSINGSETSSKVNREMALQVRSPALFDHLHDVFEYDWNHQPPQRHIVISEVMFDPDGLDTGREWVEIYNPTTSNVDLSGWYVGDVGPNGEYGSGLYRFPPGATLVAEGVIVLAHQAEDVTFKPDYEFLIDRHRDDPSVPNLVPAGSWDGFGLALGNAGDEVLLLDADQAPVDVVTYGEGEYPGVVPHPGVSAPGHSLERRPPREDTDDCSVDFFDRVPPTPGTLPE